MFLNKKGVVTNKALPALESVLVSSAKVEGRTQALSQTKGFKSWFHTLTGDVDSGKLPHLF